MDVNTLQSIPGLRTSTSSSEQDNKSRTSLGQDEFLELMTTQLSNQDPFEPMDNGEFLAQIAQFGTVNGINELLASFDSFASSIQSSQALQASNLIGRNVLVDMDEAYLASSGSVRGAVQLGSSASQVAVNIYDFSGQIINRVELGEQPPGMVQFNWDGTGFDGSRAPAGRYQIEVEAIRGDRTEALAPMVSASVVSLTLGGVGKEMQVELENLGQVGFSRVNQIL